MKTWEIYKFGNLSISVVLEGNSVWTIEILKRQIHLFIENIASFSPFFQIIYGNEKELKLNFSNQNELIKYSIKLAEKETELNNSVKDILGDIAKKIEIEKENENASSSIITFTCSVACCSSRNATRTSKGTKSNRNLFTKI